jgi:uncharacterized protein YbjT (DUF2867 family)
MIAVIGGTGTTGREVVAGLLAAGADFTCIVRDVDRAEGQLGDAVALAEGDLADPASIEAACRGCETLFLLSGDSPAMADQQKGAIDAARRAGVRRIVNASGMMLDPAMMIPRLRLEIEDHLKASGAEWTLLRPNFFRQNLLRTAAAVRIEDRMVLPFPPDVPIAMIDVRDTADAAVRVLTEDGHAGATYALTGIPVTLQECAAALSPILGKDVAYVQVPLAEAQATMREQGAPDWVLDHFANITDCIESGGLSRETDDFENLTGYPPRGLDDFFARYIMAFGGGRGMAG